MINKINSTTTSVIKNLPYLKRLQILAKICGKLISRKLVLGVAAQLKTRYLNKIHYFYFSVWIFFHQHSRFTGQQGKEKTISLISLYHFHPSHRHLDISRAITAESSPLHIGNSRIRSGHLWFPSANRYPLESALKLEQIKEN